MYRQVNKCVYSQIQIRIVQFISYFGPLRSGRIFWEMIGLDSYSRLVFIYLDPILIYISLLNRLPIWNSQNYSMFPLASLPGDYRVTDEALLAETT